MQEWGAEGAAGLCAHPGSGGMSARRGLGPAGAGASTQTLEQAFAPTLLDFATQAHALLQQKPLVLAQGQWVDDMGASSHPSSFTALPILGFCYARSDRGPSCRHGCKTGWQAGNWGWRRHLLVMQHPWRPHRLSGSSTPGGLCAGSHGK